MYSVPAFMDNTPAKRDNTTPSCAVCQRRKVKCTRNYPCGPCQKSGLECSFPPPKPAAARSRVGGKRKRDSEDGRGQLQQSQESITSPLTPGNTARLVADGNGYRYVNNHLWNTLPTSSSAPLSAPHPIHTRTPDGRDGDSIYESAVQLGSEIVSGRGGERVDSKIAATPGNRFLFPQSSHHFESRAREIVQPSAAQVIQLWQAYLSNVDPIMKVFHAPSVQQMVLGQIGKASMEPSGQALMSSIYLVTTVSLTEEECQTTLQETRAELISKFRMAAEDALSAAGFVTTSDIVVLRAFVLYLAALRSLGETSYVWSMTGLAIRVAGSMGLARDGSMLGLPPFECEMRRRLWWAIVYLDARTAELVGQDGDLLMQNYDVKLPSNVNDSELFPSMHRLPEHRAAATDAVYVLLRATVAYCLRSLPRESGPNGTWSRMRAPNVPVAEKLGILEATERKFEDEILRYCDPTVPLQKICINSACTFLVKMRLVSGLPYSTGSAQEKLENGYSDDVFQLSFRIMQLQLELWTEPGMQKWRWHWQGQFQWYAFAELLRQTRLRKPDELTSKAWAMIHSVFQIIVPTLEVGSKSPLLNGLKTLLNTASSSCRVASESRANGEVRSSERSLDETRPPSAQSAAPAVFGHGYGSAPHDALLPGMSNARGHLQEGSAAAVDPSLAFDYEAIDWDEFDRLTNELCGQKN
ncbi:hypothetical protein KC360_g358 [Hortaea werneckii]|nr:hypothetical protein KC325_g1683 [Hortaea werneckii]KAI6998901.1 hypothetical protein KC359_g2063 [Hortaea werneckii]KAI7149411.1 hypothetical protein KC344_g1037 [Hortaea werneckii]KAI7180034.1 hypothetical protein KC360_g358 [Hortaea werneckii]